MSLVSFDTSLQQLFCVIMSAVMLPIVILVFLCVQLYYQLFSLCHKAYCYITICYFSVTICYFSITICYLSVTLCYFSVTICYFSVIGKLWLLIFYQEIYFSANYIIIGITLVLIMSQLVLP